MQTDRGRITKLGSCTTDVECAALGEEVDAPAVNGRLDSERLAQRLAHRAGRPERPHWQVQSWRRNVRFLGDDLGETIEARDFPAREYVGSSSGPRGRGAEPKAFDEIVDICQVVKNLPAAENDESPAGDTAKEFQQTAIAGTINSGRPGDHDFHRRLPRRCLRDPLTFQFCLLVDVTRP